MQADDDKQHEKENIAPQESTATLNVSRIINLEQLASFISDILSHLQSCEPGTVSLVGETYRNGMASVLSARCSSCRTEIAFSTSHKINGIGSGKRWESNVAAVWGQMATGGGHAHLSEAMSVLGVPVMTKKAFMATESAVNKCWLESLEESMKETAEEGKKLLYKEAHIMRGFQLLQ